MGEQAISMNRPTEGSRNFASMGQQKFYASLARSTAHFMVKIQSDERIWFSAFALTVW